MTKKGKLILFGDVGDRLTFSPNSKAEFNNVRNHFKNDLKNRASFGWINPDYRQATVEDNLDNAVAKPEDFLAFPFRHLTATIVGGGSWKATEFSEKVLKEAAHLLSNKPVYVNHEMETGNIVGVNGEISYVGKKDGVPGGLEGAIWIDGKLHTDLTRKLTAYPVPHIQSVSVTVSYEWEPSHTFTNTDGDDDEWLFERRIGTMVDGKMVRRVVTKILDFYETSLVWLGADPYAKILDESGKPLNIERSAVVAPGQFDKDPLAEIYRGSGLLLINDDSLSKENITKLKATARNEYAKTGNLEQNFKTDNDKKMEKVLKALATKLGKDVNDITEADIESSNFNVVSKTKLDEYEKAVKDAKESGDKVVELQASVDTLQGNVDTYSKIIPTADLEEFSKEIELGKVVGLSKYGKTVLDAKRDKAVNSYKLAVGDENVSEAVVETIKGSNIEALDGFLKQYGAGAFEEFGATCKSCGTGDFITFRTSTPDGSEGADNYVAPSMAKAMRG